MLIVPRKYSRFGIKVKCLHRHCKYQISDTCPLIKKKISACPHKSYHRFQLIVCVPKGLGTKKTRIAKTVKFEDALIEMAQFRKELAINGYHKNVLIKQEANNTVSELAVEYLDCISGEGSYTFMNMKRSTEHVKESRRVLERFLKSLKIHGYNIQILKIADIGNDEVQIFYDYIYNTLRLESHNKHFVILKTFFNYIIDKKDIKINNPFKHASLSYDKKEKNIIAKDEFQKLLNVITYANGVFSDSGKKRNYYKKWLIPAFRLAIETGLRREELVKLKWSDLITIDNGALVFRIANLKVNRIMSSGNSKNNINSSNLRYVKHVPVTKSLRILLTELGYATKKKTDDYIIERPDGTEIKYMMDSLSKGFAHYIKKITNRKIELKDLRKTYISSLAVALGDKLKLFTGHSNDEVLQTHYISSAFLASKLEDFEIF